APALCAGAVNVIPGEVQLTLDIRGPQDAPLTALTWWRRSAPALCAGAVNVIPGEVQLTLDIRGPQDAPLTAL
ncbi:Zn-dependent hydrolase, partial [Klebsiella pneumoniae]